MCGSIIGEFSSLKTDEERRNFLRKCSYADLAEFGYCDYGPIIHSLLLCADNSIMQKLLFTLSDNQLSYVCLCLHDVIYCMFEAADDDTLASMIVNTDMLHIVFDRISPWVAIRILAIKDEILSKYKISDFAHAIYVNESILSLRDWISKLTPEEIFTK